VSRGQLRVYLGYAPGTGTTCALLREGHLRAQDGADVVVACVQTHGRPGPSELLAGLEIVSPAGVPDLGTVTGEMDPGAVLARAPDVALVDDLAHDNMPGSRHRARWQDVERLLTAGVDVISAVGIGQLDSLADAVQKITGVPRRETVPDPVVRAAGEVDLVDIVPEKLHDRMAGGHIYPPHQAQAALASWFRLGSLSSLRELALLWLAAKLASDPQRYRPGGQVPGSGRPPERVLVALDGDGIDGQVMTCTPTADGVPPAACAPGRESRGMTEEGTHRPGRARLAARRGPQQAASRGGGCGY
jgi:two-component system sensor histidine kinase KdpD